MTFIFFSGELEFSDQDDFSNLEGPHEIRVKPPPGFKEDLNLLGSKFELDNKDEQPEIQSSIGQFNAPSINPFANLLGQFGQQQQQQQQQQQTTTPTLPNFALLAGLSQEQLQQLALLQYLQNGLGLGGLGGFGRPQPQVCLATLRRQLRPNI